MEKPEELVKGSFFQLILYAAVPAVLISAILWMLFPQSWQELLLGLWGGLFLCLAGLFLIVVQFSILPPSAWKWMSLAGFALRMAFYGLGIWLLLEKGAAPLAILAGILVGRAALYIRIFLSQKRR